MLLYTFSQVYNCILYYYSTWSKPQIIVPRDNNGLSKEIQYFAVLQHRDSYTGQSTRLGLEDGHTIQMKSDTDSAAESSTVVAKKRAEGDKKTTANRHSLGSNLDTLIVEALTNKVISVYKHKWLRYKNEKCKGNLFQDFLNSLSNKSFPTGDVLEVKAIIEKNICDGMINGLLARPIFLNLRFGSVTNNLNLEPMTL